MENKLNAGVLFKNEKTKDIHPDYKGFINVNGVNMDLAAWINTSSTGKKYMSLKVSARQETAPQKKLVQAKTENVSPTDFIDDECPFN